MIQFAIMKKLRKLLGVLEPVLTSLILDDPQISAERAASAQAYKCL